MATLVIETATAACSVALIADGAVIAARHEVVGRGHAERLVPLIAEVIEDRAPPTHILVDCGPGSFTGVRVGLAAARGFGLGWGADVTGYSSLALLAAMTEADAPIAAAIPGGHGELFVQPFAAGRPLAPLRSLKPDAAGEAFDQDLVVGTGAPALVDARGHGTARDMLPDAAAAILLPADLAALPPTPIYGRAPDAKLPA